MRVLAIGLWVALECLTQRVLAADSTVDFSIDFEAEPGCSSEAEFVAAIQARLPSAKRVSSDSTGAHVRARVVAAEGAGASAIAVDLPDGASLRRELPPASCAETVSAMALIATMALEGNLDASTALPAAPVTAPPVTTPGQPSPNAAAPEPPPARSAPLPPQRAQSHAASRDEPWRSTRWQWAVAAGAGLTSGTAPGVAPLGDLGVELVAPQRSALSPSLRLTGLFAEHASDLSSPRGASASFHWLVLRPQLCPRGLASSSASLTVCALAEYGTLRGSASGIASPRDQHMAWVAAGLGLRGQLALSKVFSLEASSSARALAVHDRFIFTPSVSVYQVPEIAADFLVGLRAAWR